MRFNNALVYNKRAMFGFGIAIWASFGLPNSLFIRHTIWVFQMRVPPNIPFGNLLVASYTGAPVLNNLVRQEEEKTRDRNQSGQLLKAS